MSFADEFLNRWEMVIKPAIEDAGLEPYRVDSSRISDSILTDILNGIANSRLVFGDISETTRGYRNGNVMYEVGLAHASRQPEEVILFRSDDGALLFDVANIRVNSYSPDASPGLAREQVRQVILDAEKEIDSTKGLSVSRVVDALDPAGIELIITCIGNNGAVDYPKIASMGQMVSLFPQTLAFTRLLELGILTISPPRIPDMIESGGVDQPMSSAASFKITPFGVAVSRLLLIRMGLNDLATDTAMQERLNRLVDNEKGGDGSSR